MKLFLKNKNILFLYLNSFCRGFLITIPILTLYFQEHGLNLTQVMLLQTVFSIAVVILEVPSGYLAVLFKRKYSIILGAFFSFLGFLCYYLFSNFYGFLVGEILLGIGISLNFGADRAYLYDELVLHKQEKNYQKIEGQYMSIRYFSEAITSLLISAIIFGILGFFALFLMIFRYN